MPLATLRCDIAGVQTNELGQPVGDPVSDWSPRPVPVRTVLEGRYCRLERLHPDRHVDELFAADGHDRSGISWTYLPYGPFTNLGSYRHWVEEVCAADDPLYFAVIGTDPAAGLPTHHAVGVMSYLNIVPAHGSIEVGHIHFSPLLQRQRAATEAQFLLMRYAFDELGYRRYEWKCDALNAPSRAAAERLGFCYEGTFRQATVVKGRNRDTAWYSITDQDWARVSDGFRAWLAPDNFDERARQRQPLRSPKPE